MIRNLVFWLNAGDWEPDTVLGKIGKAALVLFRWGLNILMLLTALSYIYLAAIGQPVH